EQFVAHWADTQLKESASYVTHFDDLCELLGHPKPAHMDKTGAEFTYQKGVNISESKQGFADVFYRGHFAVEYKGKAKHKDLSEAYNQLLRYKDALENPPLLVVCDIERYEIHTNFNNAISATYTFTNADLARATPVAGTPLTALQLLDKLFHDPEALRPHQTPDDVTKDAAKRFAELADALDKKHHIPHAQAARFLVKLVFCLFCEDVGLLPKGLFQKIITTTRDNPREFARNVRDLFGAMAVGGRIVWGEPIHHFDGGLFTADADADVAGLDGADARLLERTAELNWSDVNPTIFGTLFERALDIEGKRSQLGAHYTSRADIEAIVAPVLMSPLRREWADVQQQVAQAKQKASREKLLRAFQDKLASVTVLDPACGSGNFLYVSLSLLKDLEKQVITHGLSVGVPDLEPRVHPSQLYGIEIDDFAYQLASIVVWIGYLQWKVKNGYPPAGETPILKPLNSIRQMDAILAEIPNPKTQISTEPEWSPVDVIVGNPPFLGGSKLRGELGDEYVDALFKLFSDRL
ncbi:MAG: DNA methyltransferase, partial [Chloroflexota bacterium]